MEKIEGSTQKESEIILARELDIPVIAENSEKLHRDDSRTLTLHFSKEDMDTLAQVRNLVSHAVPSGSWSDLITYLAKREIAKRTTVRKKRPARTDFDNTNVDTEELLEKENPINETTQKQKPRNAEVEKSPSRSSVLPFIRKTMITANSCCQFKDPRTGKSCGSQSFLQIDHVQPIWAGGTDHPSNLQILCGAHNRFKYAQESNTKTWSSHP
ncbi:MAG: HNH endonuclease [Proteobacteria bacterium]|nr:MAG: HNH endonuclease [Pseudomonadota bacterium]